MLREAILLYSREIAFAAADVYARAAEARGLWDARLEALVVDSILSGEYDNELPSRIAALGWNGHGEVCVLVGTAPKMLDVDQLRRTARHLDADVLIGVVMVGPFTIKLIAICAYWISARACFYINSRSRSHLVAIHLSPAMTGAPPCSVRVDGSGRS